MSLRVENVETFYGESQALFGVSLEVPSGGVATLLGRNGMGKTTTVRTILGSLRARRGEVWFGGEALGGLPVYQVVRRGIGWVPEGREIFPNLNVRENLMAAGGGDRRDGGGGRWTLEGVLELFPQLAGRLHHMGGQLSGGEQQMTAIARALLLNPRLLILDEATEGLAPLVRKEIWRTLFAIKERGVGMLVIDKNLRELGELADRHYILEKGRVVWSGSSGELGGVGERYLGV